MAVAPVDQKRAFLSMAGQKPRVFKIKFSSARLL